MNVKRLEADLLIIGGGTAGCYAAITAAAERSDVSVIVAEKANIRRSGCLAAGVNAINAYITKGETPESYLDFVRWDAAGLIRDDLVLTMAQGFNETARKLEELGLVILKDASGEYVARGRQNIKINGENIKPILADAVNTLPNVTSKFLQLLTPFATVFDTIRPSVRIYAAKPMSIAANTKNLIWPRQSSVQ